MIGGDLSLWCFRLERLDAVHLLPLLEQVLESNEILMLSLQIKLEERELRRSEEMISYLYPALNFSFQVSIFMLERRSRLVCEENMGFSKNPIFVCSVLPSSLSK